MRKFLILVLIVAAGIASWNAFVRITSQVDCVRVLDGPRDQVGRAIEVIKKHSPEDYDRLCDHGTYIAFHEEPSPLGRYYPKSSRTPDGVGLVSLSKDFADDVVYLSGIIVHEVCHGYLIATQDDWREEPCVDAQRAYLEHVPDERIRESIVESMGQAQSVYCGQSGRRNGNVSGYCVFINNSEEDAQLCAGVFVRGTPEENAQNICADTTPGSHAREEFILSIPQGVVIPDYAGAVMFLSDHALQEAGNAARATHEEEGSDVSREEEVSFLSGILCRLLGVCSP